MLGCLSNVPFHTTDFVAALIKLFSSQVGRAGRFGTKGLAITFVASEDDSKVLNQVGPSTSRVLCCTHSVDLIFWKEWCHVII